MKKRIVLWCVAIAAVFTSCGPHMYKTQSGGQDNVSYIIVLKEYGSYENVSVILDDKVFYPYGKVYKVKNKRKAHPIIVEPGRHNIKVAVDDVLLTDEDVFLGLQETKSIVLR